MAVAPTLSICIVNWNTRGLLRECLRSIYQYPPEQPFEVIVVDNASSDGSAEMVRVEFPQVVLIANEANLGYARGNNQAMERARGEFILLLNPDTEMRSDTLRNAIHFLREHPEVGAIGAKQVLPDGRVQPSVRGFPTPRNLLFEVLGLARLFPRSRLFAAYRMRWFAYDRPMPVDQPMGTFLMVRRAVMEQVGLLDEAFPLFFNDVDWCYRMWQAGWQIWFVPQVEILHHGGASTKQVRPAAIRESHRALEQFYRKHYRSRLPLPLYALIVVLIRLSMWLRLLWLQLRSSGGPHS
ncbi:N-acetylglucosaminyl-diphospho-decaprenol L-rhamnosyltransferase [bacterium HR15]|nr:N-acetylglucosaminyl-diphospho-decaprenol L-rhamnosyltransferase [bacterium HR15]